MIIQKRKTPSRSITAIPPLPKPLVLALALLLLQTILSCSSMSKVRAMATASSSSKKKIVAFHWFRNNDLRVHDNPALMHSIKTSDYCIPIYCFDGNTFGNDCRTPFGNLKIGPKRAKFILESVQDLRQQLESKGCGLVVFNSTKGPAECFHQILSKLSLNSDQCQYKIVCQEEVLKEEKDAAKAVQRVLKSFQPQAKLEQIWGSTMYDLKDLPFEDGLQDMPDVFTPFRNKVEKNAFIEAPLPSPRLISLPPKESLEYQTIAEYLTPMPTLKDLGYTSEQVLFAEAYDQRGVMDFKGGETAALARVQDYIWDKDRLRIYFDTRNGMLGPDYSTKFSPWLAHGCLSPRKVAAECKRYEEKVVANKSTYWVVFELLWRDFWKFFCLKHGDAVFFPSGTIGKHKKWSNFSKNFQAWKDGNTGYPLVDANMRELKATGFMSNRGRQNVASFLSIDMNHDWRYGADLFESTLLDYDVYSNWGNWCAAAGQTGGRLNRFNIVKQSKDYDQHGEYVRHWIPELANVPNEFVHEPWKMTQFHQQQFGCQLGVDYPNPIIPPSGSGSVGGERSTGGQRGQKNKSRKPNDRNRHQKYEMKSLKEGGYEMKGK